MAIHVSKSYEYISIPQKLSDVLSNLAMQAAAATILGRNDVFNIAKSKYDVLYGSWKRQADAYAKENSYSNWLGGGKEIGVQDMNWNDQYDFWLDILSNNSIPKSQLSKAVNYEIE